MTDLWSKADLHIHSQHSDGAHDIPTILAHVATHTDLRVIAITDHDCISGALEARALAPRYGLEVVIGEEVSTDRGHLLALFIRDQVPSGLSIPETVAAVHEQGGIAVLAHPCDRICNSPLRHRPRPTLDDWRSFGLDGLEGINGCQLDPLANPRSQAMARRLCLASTGGSDAHHKDVIGVAHTLFRGRSAGDLRRALLERATIASGRRWSSSEYVAWVRESMLPRAWRSLRGPAAMPTAGGIG